MWHVLVLALLRTTLEKIEEAIRNGQAWDTNNIGQARYRTKANKTSKTIQHNTHKDERHRTHQNRRWTQGLSKRYLSLIQIQIFLFPIKEPFQAEQLTKNLIQWLWIDYIDWKMTTFYETNKSKFNHTNYVI